MNTLNRHRLLVGTGFLILFGGVTYSCKDFLNALPQGVLNQATLTNAAGVEGSLIAAYRALDCTNSTNADWGGGSVLLRKRHFGFQEDQCRRERHDPYPRGLGLGHHVAWPGGGGAPQRRKGTSHQVDGDCLQGPGAGLRPRLRRRDNDPAVGRGEWRLWPGNELRSRLDRLPAVCRRAGDHPGLPGLRQ